MGQPARSVVNPHQAELDAAYRRGRQERNAEIASLNARIGDLIKDRQNALDALVDAIYDDQRRAQIRAKLEEAYGISGGTTIVVMPDVDFLENPESLTSNDYTPCSGCSVKLCPDCNG